MRRSAEVFSITSEGDGISQSEGEHAQLSRLADPLALLCVDEEGRLATLWKRERERERGREGEKTSDEVC